MPPPWLRTGGRPVSGAVWQARPGRFVVRAVDELGRAPTQTLTVELLGDGRTPRVGG